MVALAGGAGGALLVLWITDALAAWKPAMEVPLTLNVTPDARVFLVALLASVLTTLLFGLLPALQATKTDLVPALKNEAVSERSRRWHLRDYMVASQVALSVLLLVCSVLVVRSFQRALHAPIGYNPEGAVTASFDLNLQAYNEPRGRAFERQLLDKVRALPGIESAAMVDWLPLSLNGSSTGIYIEGQPKPKAAEAPIAYYFSASPDYLSHHADQADRRARVRRPRQGRRQPRGGGQQSLCPTIAARPERHWKTVFRPARSEAHRDCGRGRRWQVLLAGRKQKPAFWGPREIWYTASAALVARTRLDGAQAVRLMRKCRARSRPHHRAIRTGTMIEQLDLPLFLLAWRHRRWALSACWR